MKTAIIDNGIDIGTLSRYNQQPESLMVYNGEIVSSVPPAEITHGGLCARVFAEQSGVLPNVSISLSRDNSQRSNVNDLSIALDWCSMNGIELISLSMGTTRHNDSSLLYSAVEKLQQAGTVLVSAASNDCQITYPAALTSCIGVCQTYYPGLEPEYFTYLERPFDGINVVTYPVYLPDLHIYGSNSLSAAYIAGKICKEYSGMPEIGDIRSWLSEQAQRMPVGWEQSYLQDKVSRTEQHEAIIIACCTISTEQEDIFMKALWEQIIKDGYSCAILVKSGESNLSDYRFSLESHKMPLPETLLFITRLCRPSVIVTNEWELTYSADVIVQDGIAYKKIDSAARLTCLFSEVTPEGVWQKVCELFENKMDA